MVRSPFTFGIPQSHPYARIGDTANTIHFTLVLLPHLVATLETDLLDIPAFVTRNRETVIHPKERADLHLFVRLAHLLDAVGTQAKDFARPDKSVYFIIQVRQTARFAGSGIGSVFFTYNNRCTSPLVTGHDDTVFRQQQHGTGTFDPVVDIFNTFDKILSLRNQQRYQFGLVRLARTQFGEVHIRFQQILFQFLDVIYLGNRHDGELTEMGVDDNRLRIRIADDTDSGISHKLVESRLELCTKIRTFQIVNRTGKTSFLIVCSHTAAPGPQMRIIVGAIE